MPVDSNDVAKIHAAIRYVQIVRRLSRVLFLQTSTSRMSGERGDKHILNLFGVVSAGDVAQGKTTHICMSNQILGQEKCED